MNRRKWRRITVDRPGCGGHKKTGNKKAKKERPIRRERERKREREDEAKKKGIQELASYFDWISNDLTRLLLAATFLSFYRVSMAL